MSQRDWPRSEDSDSTRLVSQIIQWSAGKLASTANDTVEFPASLGVPPISVVTDECDTSRACTMTIHDTVTGATTKALFFCIEKHFLQEAEIHACITGVIKFLLFVLDFAYSALPGGTRKCRPVYDAKGRGVGFFYSFVAGARSTHIAVLRCISRYSGQVGGVRMNSNTRRRRFLCREVMSVRLRKHSSEVLLEMGLLPTADICEEFGRAERNYRYPPALEEEDRQPFRCIYMYLSQYLYETVAINVLYAVRSTIFAT